MNFTCVQVTSVIDHSWTKNVPYGRKSLYAQFTKKNEENKKSNDLHVIHWMYKPSILHKFSYTYLLNLPMSLSVICCRSHQTLHARATVPWWISKVTTPCSAVVTPALRAFNFATAWCSSPWISLFAMLGSVTLWSHLTSAMRVMIPLRLAVVLVWPVAPTSSFTPGAVTPTVARA